MPINFTRLNAQHKAMLDHLADGDTGGTFSDLVFEGQTITCNIVSANREILAERISDSIEDVELSLECNRQDFIDVASLPKRGETLTFQSKTLRIIHVENFTDGVAIRLHCGSKYQRGTR